MIKKVIISGGREIGGLNSFASALADGFREINIEVEVLSIKDIALGRKKGLRDSNILKIFSTKAVFLSPLSKNSICVAHGFPRLDGQSFLTWAMILFSFWIAKKASILVSVSYYVKRHLTACYDIQPDYVIYNPVSNLFLNSNTNDNSREYITYIGRFHKVKKVELFINPLKKVLDTNPNMKVILVGHGDEKNNILDLISGDSRFEILDSLSHSKIRELLENTKVFFSGCETEALGISYIEALSQGANVVMPNSGGGLEIAPNLIGSRIFTYSLKEDFDEIVDVFYNALAIEENKYFSAQNFSAKIVAREYLKLSNHEEKR
jgi:glycosyltransferase involved in cell wall biosynthesis